MPLGSMKKAEPVTVETPRSTSSWVLLPLRAATAAMWRSAACRAVRVSEATPTARRAAALHTPWETRCSATVTPSGRVKLRASAAVSKRSAWVREPA